MEVFQLINEERKGEVDYHNLTTPDEMIDNDTIHWSNSYFSTFTCIHL